MVKLYSVKIKDIEIPVKLISNRNCKNIKISFNLSNGYMNISKPIYVSINYIKKHIKLNEKLIYNEYLKMLKRKNEINFEKEKISRKWVSGEKLLFLGKEYEIEIIEVNDNIITLSFEEDSKIVITIKSKLDDEIKKDNIVKIVKKMLKEKTEEIVYERLNYWSNITGIYYNDFKVKHVKTIWGSCRKSTQTLTFSSKLCMFKLEVIDSIILHELCHIIHANHSKDYWNLVYSFIPNYKECNMWIKENINKFELE